MATVKMKRGSHYADIFDSPETIGQAEKDGYVLAEEKKSETKFEPEIEPASDIEEEAVEDETPVDTETPEDKAGETIEPHESETEPVKNEGGKNGRSKR